MKVLFKFRYKGEKGFTNLRKGKEDMISIDRHKPAYHEDQLLIRDDFPVPVTTDLIKRPDSLMTVTRSVRAKRKTRSLSRLLTSSPHIPRGQPSQITFLRIISSSRILFNNIISNIFLKVIQRHRPTDNHFSSISLH